MQAPEEVGFDSYAEYRTAVLAAVGRAQETVAIFDPDLRETGLESAEGLALLEGLCARSGRHDTLRILLHSTSWLEKECPRLLGLLGRYAHCASVRTSDTGARAWPQPFLLADDRHLVTRFHHDLPRGKTAGPSNVLAQLSTQFETFWMNGERRAAGVPLGI